MADPSTPETAYWNLRVDCPHCGQQGTVPWDRFSPKERVRCHRCEQWFRVEPQGSATKVEAPDAAITVAVRGASSDWTEHLAPESGRIERRGASAGWRGLLGWRSGVAVAVALCAVLPLGWRMLGGGMSLEPEKSAYQEPESLADRAAAFSLAWACNDTPTMARFTAPGQTKAFITWLSTAQLAPVFDDAQPDEIKAETISVAPRKESRRAIVTVSLTLREVLAPPKDTRGYTHRELWTELDGKWFFAPDETIKASASSAPMQLR